MTKVVLVHGTSVREPQFSETFELIKSQLHKELPHLDIVPCSWGNSLGAKLNADGASIPLYDSSRNSERTPEADEEIIRWQQLYQDPLYELRLLSLKTPEEQDFIPGQDDPGEELDKNVQQLSPSDDLQAKLQEGGIAEVFDRARQNVVRSTPYREALETISDTVTEYRNAIARAIIAEGMAICEGQGKFVPILTDAALRDRVVQSLSYEIIESEKAVSDWLKDRISGLAASVATNHVKRKRGSITDSAYPIVGDILLYQGRGEKIRNFIKTYIDDADSSVVLIAHSLGGIACVDLLVQEQLEKVKLLVTVGSQAPFFYEINARSTLQEGLYRYDAIARLKDINLERGTKIPVLTLNPEITSLWSDFLVGKYDGVMAGFVIPSASDFKPPPQLAQSRVRELNAEQRVERFRKISSPLGRKLAGLLMAAPVITLPVVRLIQKTLLPKSQPVHVAEVFLGGLLKPLTEITTDTNPDGILFEVMNDRIRNILLDDAPFSDSVIIFETISDYIESQLGKSLKECVGLLNGQSEDGKEETVAKAYAEISLKVLKRLGGSYQDLAEELEKSLHKEKPGTHKIADKILTFQVATIEIQETRSFEFSVATLELQPSPSVDKEVEWVINRQQKQGTAIIEVLEPDVELELIEIPGGSFIMGAPEEELESKDRERPQHQVTVPSFYMGRYPITQAQWKAVAELEPVERELDSDPSRFKEDYEGIDRWTRPVESISWEDAVEFCDRLSQKTGKEYRLPTEAEWEYACRAGTTTPFHFGETISTELANYDGNYTYGKGVKGEYREQTTPVGYFKVANAFGLYDMHGNVWDWCEDDWHENYEGAPTDGRAWLTDDKSRFKVLRGGSWVSRTNYCRSAFRYYVTRNFRNDDIGFSVVCVAPRTT